MRFFPTAVVFGAAFQLVFAMPNGAQAGATATLNAGNPESPSPSATDWEKVSLFGDVGDVLGIAWKASYTQLLDAENLTILGVGGLATWAADANDDGWLRKLRSRDYLTNDVMSVIGDETALAMAAVPLATWLLANRFEDEKLRSFSLETLSGITLVYAETLLIAHAIPTHERPRDLDGDPASSFFDTAFRGNYSFPSGHLIGPLMVTLKAWDYYGWKAAIVPATVTTVSAFNRIGDGSHYPSDVVAATVLSISAHLSTRRQTERRNGGFRWGASPVAGGGLMLTGGFDF